MSMLKLGEKNPYWKGDKVTYVALHLWVKTRLPKPEKCQDCNIKPPLDLANITGIYNRELKNWKYLCRRCHMLSDGRMANLHLPSDRLSEAVKKGWAKLSKEDRYARVKKGWIKRRQS